MFGEWKNLQTYFVDMQIQFMMIAYWLVHIIQNSGLPLDFYSWVHWMMKSFEWMETKIIGQKDIKFIQLIEFFSY